MVEDNSFSDGSCDGEPLSLAQDVKRELARENASWHSMRLYRPSYTCCQWGRAVYLWCIYRDGCIHCLVGVECLARWFKDRDKVKWVLQKWEKEVQVEPILHSTPNVNVGGSSASVASCARLSNATLDPVSPIYSPITSHFGCHSAEEILGDVCKALGDSHGSFRPSLSEVKALLGDNWGQILHAMVPCRFGFQYEFEAHHFRDLATESYGTNCVEIVVYYWWSRDHSQCGLGHNGCGMGCL